MTVARCVGAGNCLEIRFIEMLLGHWYAGGLRLPFVRYCSEGCHLTRVFMSDLYSSPDHKVIQNE